MGMTRRRLEALERNIPGISTEDLELLEKHISALTGAGDTFVEALYNSPDGPLDGDLGVHSVKVLNASAEIATSTVELRTILRKYK